jgi:FkbM family methyltransferase
MAERESVCDALQYRCDSSIYHQSPLCRKEPLQGVKRWLAWQIAARLAPGPVAFDFVEPARLFACSGLTAPSGNLYVGMQEFEDIAFAIHMLRPGDLFCDVGANIGAYTILASAVSGARSVAFEPVSGTYAWLLQNIHLNGVADKVVARHAAVGAEIGTARITSNLDTVNHVTSENSISDPATNEQVEVTTLDAIFSEEAPTLIKIDVEDFETAVLNGGAPSLADPRLRTVVAELSGGGATYAHDDAVIRYRLESLGFECVQYLPFERRIIDRETFEPGNVVFVRDKEWVADRLRQAPPFRCRGVQV